MGELANYSIETDQVVLLAFRDGQRVRVHVSRLSRYLGPRDLEKVRAALKLRRDFIRKHMPKAALVLAAGGLLALLAVGGHEVATIMGHSHQAPPAPSHTAIVRSQTLPEPTMAPSQTPAVQGDATVAVAPSPQPPRKVAKHVQTAPAVATASVPLVSPTPSPAPSAAPAATPALTPAPTPSPDPIADSNPPSSNDQPAPSPTPTPIPNQGEVLGDSTGPDSP